MSDQAAAIASLVGEAVPHGIGVAVSPDGEILRRADVFPFSFAFQFTGRIFQAVASEAGEAVRVDLTADFGILPYTQENRQRRAEIMHVLEALSSARLGWTITPAQRVQFQHGFPIDHSATPSCIVTELVAHLMPLQGWFDLLAGICVQEAAAA